MPAKPVLVIGAGVVGLSLADGLRKANTPFLVFEHDDDISARGQGWAITIHWALGFLKSLVSDETFARVDGTQVDPEVGPNDKPKFIFINLETLEPKFRIPTTSERRRVNREKFRNVLLQEVRDKVRWGSRFAGVEEAGDDNGGGVVAVFEDGSRLVAPGTYRNARLPVRLTGVAVDLTPAQAAPLRALDPLLFQGCHPASGNFLWVSTLETPEANGTEGTGRERYRFQIIVSWMYRSPDDEVKGTNGGRLAEMKRRAEGFHGSLRGVIDSIPQDTECLEIVLQDWPCLDWDNQGGRVTLAGDAAHAMTMYRGEAANHGILDALRLCGVLEGVYQGAQGMEEGICQYEKELRSRTSAAVLLSRQGAWMRTTGRA